MKIHPKRPRDGPVKIERQNGRFGSLFGHLGYPKIFDAKPPASHKAWLLRGRNLGQLPTSLSPFILWCSNPATTIGFLFGTEQEEKAMVGDAR
jgi:hypothetical protein